MGKNVMRCQSSKGGGGGGGGVCLNEFLENNK